MIYPELFDNITVEMMRDSVVAHELGHAWAYMEYGVSQVEVEIFNGTLMPGGIARPVRPANLLVSRRGSAVISIAGAVFQLLWLYDRGARLKEGYGFRDFWNQIEGFQSDREKLNEEIGGFEDKDALLRICYDDAKEMYISSGGSQWVAQMKDHLMPTPRGFMLTIMDPQLAAA